MVTRQPLRVGATYAGKIVTVHVEDTHFRVTCDGAEISSCTPALSSAPSRDGKPKSTPRGPSACPASREPVNHVGSRNCQKSSETSHHSQGRRVRAAVGRERIQRTPLQRLVDDRHRHPGTVPADPAAALPPELELDLPAHRPGRPRPSCGPPPSAAHSPTASPSPPPPAAGTTTAARHTKMTRSVTLSCRSRSATRPSRPAAASPARPPSPASSCPSPRPPGSPNLARQYAAGLITRTRLAFALRWSLRRRCHQAPPGGITTALGSSSRQDSQQQRGKEVTECNLSASQDFTLSGSANTHRKIVTVILTSPDRSPPFTATQAINPIAQPKYPDRPTGSAKSVVIRIS